MLLLCLPSQVCPWIVQAIAPQGHHSPLHSRPNPPRQLQPLLLPLRVRHRLPHKSNNVLFQAGGLNRGSP